MERISEERARTLLNKQTIGHIHYMQGGNVSPDQERFVVQYEDHYALVDRNQVTFSDAGDLADTEYGVSVNDSVIESLKTSDSSPSP